MGELAKKAELTSAAQFVDVIYLDFSKAFDTVSHGIVLVLMALTGAAWKTGWMSGTRVVGNGVTPSLWPVSGGLPQGSALRISEVLLRGSF